MNSVQNRSDYFDFDDIESRRKKPKNEKRKRPAANGTSSAGGEEVTKKPRNKVTKPAAPRVQGNISKKTKSVKSVKRASLSKPVILAPGTTLIPGPRSSLPSRSIALSTLPNNAPTNSGGIIQGVTVPISGVNAPISGVNVPVSAVNVPVSAVIKQGSLGGRSFVFSCPQQANSSATSAGLVAPACVMTSGDGGDAQHLKIVMNSSPGSLTKVPEQKNMATVTSPLRQPIVQYKSNVVTSALVATSTNPTAASTTIGSVVSPGLVSSKAATTVAKDSERGTLVTSPAVTSSMTVSSVSHKTLPGNPSPVARRVVSTSAVVSTPSSRTTVVPSSSQAQFIMRKGQLSTISKPGGVRVSVPPAVNVKSAQGPQVQRGATPANGSRAVVRSSQGTSQQTSTTKSDGSAKDSTTNLPVSSQAVTALLRKTPSPQTVTRTIQVGVKDPKKPLLTKRTVTYSPSTSTRSVSVVSRTVPSSFVGGIVTRTPTSSSNGQTLIPTTSTYRLNAQLKNLQDLGKQSMTTPLPGTQLASTQSKNVQQLIKQSVTTPVVSAQLKNIQRSSPQLVSASPTTARSVRASTPSASSTAAQKSSTQSVSALETNEKPKNTQSSETSSLPSSQKGRSGTVYQESDDEKLVEKIRGIVKDVVSGTPRSRHGTVQRIVMTTKSTTPAVVASRANTVTEVSQSKGSETVEEKKSTDDSTN